MGERQSSPEGPPSKDDSVPSVVSPPQTPLTLDDDADAHTIYSVNTHFYARARSIHPGRRGDNETL
jgi:hypothetical protein